MRCSPRPPRAEDFRQALRRRFQEATEAGRRFVDVQAGDLHRDAGGYPGPHHRMPNCCHVMYAEMREGDQILYAPPGGYGASLRIRYRLPRHD